MGEMASLLSEVAEALTYYPGELRIRHDESTGSAALARSASMTINAREWPSIQDNEQLIENWRALTIMGGATAGRLAPGRRA
jgi:hypothetical protein